METIEKQKLISATEKIDENISDKNFATKKEIGEKVSEKMSGEDIWERLPTNVISHKTQEMCKNKDDNVDSYLHYRRPDDPRPPSFASA
ncbi:MAG: hypothetical protein WCG98_01540 [bacterium]